MELKNVEDYLNKYGDILLQNLSNNVGVKTGSLKYSLDVELKKDTYVLNMLDYGVFINPWKKKTGEENSPGYLKIFDNVVNQLNNDGLSEAFNKDLELYLTKTFR